MRTYMYLRPGNLYKEFIVEENTSSITATGRLKPSYDKDGKHMLKGVLADADDKQKIRFEQIGHPITHTIVQQGKPKAKPEDKLLCGNRVFLIQGIDDAGNLGICTIYYAEERMDVK